MGLTTVDLILKHPQKLSKTETAEFLVDSDVSYTVVPERLVKRLGLTPSFYREFTLADGKRVKRPIGSGGNSTGRR